jgi:hypothetical protein
VWANDYVVSVPCALKAKGQRFLGIQHDFVVFWPGFQKTSKKTANAGRLASEFAGVDSDAHQPPRRW